MVLQVLPALTTGGVERTTCDVARALIQAGWTAVVVSAGGPMVHELERMGAKHIVLPLDSKNPFVMRKNVERLTAVIRQFNVDLVHARSRAPAWSARAAARQAGVPFLTTFHGTYSGWRNPLKRAYNAIMAKGDLVIANSAFTGDHVRRHYKVATDRVRVIPRGVNMLWFDPSLVSAERMIKLSRDWALPDGARVVMLPGRLTKWKGQLVLIEAMAELRRRRPDLEVVCVLVGDHQGRNSYRDSLLETIRRLGVEGAVRVVGHCRDMAAAYMLSDVVVSASTDPEAFGRVSAEASAMGRPVVASDHGGSREIVLPGETGLLVPPGDVAALATALEQALALDEPARAGLAERARAHVARHFTVETMTAATLEVYRELLGDPPAPGLEPDGEHS